MRRQEMTAGKATANNCREDGRTSLVKHSRSRVQGLFVGVLHVAQGRGKIREHPTLWVCTAVAVAHLQSRSKQTDKNAPAYQRAKKTAVNTRIHHTFRVVCFFTNATPPSFHLSFPTPHSHTRYGVVMRYLSASGPSRLKWGRVPPVEQATPKGHSQRKKSECMLNRHEVELCLAMHPSTRPPSIAIDIGKTNAIRCI